MRSIIKILLLIHISIFSWAQKVREVTCKPGQDFAKAFSAKDKYKYPEFQDGYVVTPQGKRSQRLKLNFNEFSALPQFVNEKGDTLFLDKGLAEYVQIKETTYYHPSSNDYYEIIKTSPMVKLAIVREWRITRVETLVEHPKSGKLTKSMSRDKGNLIYSKEYGRYVRNEHVIFARESVYYFIDAIGKVQKANKNGIAKLLSQHEAAIDKYVEMERIDFKKEEDLTKLFEFCKQVQSR